MKIQVIAPSACVDAAPIQLAQQQLPPFGVEAILSTHIFAQHRYLAGTTQQRIADLKHACEHPDIDAIWCGRGGTGAAQLLPDLDTWLLNKPIIGYSDSTVLLNYIAMRGGQAIHAPVFQEIAVKNLGEYSSISNDAQEVLALLSPLFATQPQHYPVSAYNADATVSTITGKILGGNLTTLCSVQGTPWALKLEQPSILLLEDVGEPFYRLERLLLQLLQSVDISQLKAIVFGDFYQCPQKNVPHSLIEIFAEHCQRFNIPLFVGDWFGHGERNRPFWIGKQGQMTAEGLWI
jgi:muramoyltetrapeptide carboxypeptidase